MKSRLLAAMLAASLCSSAALAETLMPEPSSLVNVAPDFRLHQSLHLDALDTPSQEGLVSQAGLHWGDTPKGPWLQGKLPNAVLQVSDEVKHLILADLKEHRLFLLENDHGLRVLRHMYATIGKNGTRKNVQDDGRTPIGVYTVTRYLDDRALPELYGAGAFPLNYPNDWDKRAKRTGYGIWVHGVPRDKYTRPPLSSEGCVAVGNEDFNSLKPFVEPGKTRVIFSDELRWLEPEQQKQRLDSFQAELEAWRQSWNSLDTEAYLAYYAEDFATETMNREQFAAHKHRVNAHKKFIQVELNHVNIFDYPQNEDLRLVEFQQNYRSDTYQDISRKQLYWRKQADGHWRIVQELES